LKKIQDGIRFRKFLQKSIERKILLQKSQFSQFCRLQARLKKLKCKNFPIFKIYNLSKTQNFQNLSFHFRELRPKKKLLQITLRIAKKMAGIGESMIPTFGGLANIDAIAKNRAE
jgi:hypothetical protein